MIRNEISKIVKSPYMWGVLLFCILINCGILCFENTEDFSSSQYKKVWQQFLSEEKNLQDEIASSKDKAEKYKQNEMTDKEKLYVRFAKELEAVSTYNDYRQRIQENAKKITLFSTFTEGGFAEKNIEKTAAHFKKMKMVKVVAEPSLGIEKMFSTVTGIVVLFFVLYLGYLLFVRENETGIAKLLYVTRFGKRKLFFAKLAAHIWGTAVAALIFYGCNYVILRERYGIGDLSRSIQSVLAYRSCGSELSVGQFLILSMIILIFIMTALAIFIDCICILGKKALISIMIFFFCIIGCVLVYVQIPMNSNLNWLKYIDPAYCLNAGDIIGKYVNINILGEPVSYPVVVMAVYFLLLLISMICGMIGFSKMKEESRKSGLFNFAFMKNEKRFLKGHDSLFRFELYKVRKGGRVGMILFLFLIVSCFLSYQSHLIFDDEDEYYYYTYMKQLGYDEVAKICLTHSFNNHTIDDYIGKFDVSDEELRLIKTELDKAVYDEYDRLIQLCDSLAGADGVLDVEDRMKDVKKRYGFYPQAKWDTNIRLMQYFEKKMNQNIYLVCEKDTFVPEDI